MNGFPDGPGSTAARETPEATKPNSIEQHLESRMKQAAMVHDYHDFSKVEESVSVSNESGVTNANFVRKQSRELVPHTADTLVFCRLADTAPLLSERRDRRRSSFSGDVGSTWQELCRS